MTISYGDGTIIGLLDRAAVAGAGRGVWWGDAFVSYAELAEESRRIAAGLVAHGLKSGDRAAIWSTNCPDMLSLLFGCARVGVATLLVNTRLSSAEAAEIVARAESRALFFYQGGGKGGYRAKIEAMGEGLLSQLDLIVALNTSEGFGLPGAEAVPTAALRQSGRLDTVMAVPETPSLLFSTSGSTGLAKLVQHTNRSVATHAVDVAVALGLDIPDAAVLSPVPVAGAYGATIVAASIAAAAPLSLTDQFDASEVAELIRRRNITYLHGFDEIVARLLEAAPGDRPFPSLRSCIYAKFNGGYPRLIEDCEKRGIPLRGAYGSSEMLALFALQPMSAPLDKRLTAGGRLTSPDARVRIRDVDSGALLPAGQSGEIELAGPSGFACYFRNPEVTSRQLLEDGYFRTGDVGRVAEDGTLIYESRIDEIIRLSGYMVSVVEIETFIESLEGVDRCQVVRVFTKDGPRAFAFVQMLDGSRFDAAGLRAACEAGLSSFKVPVGFRLVDTFPVGNSLNAPKINKLLLREEAQKLFADYDPKRSLSG